MSDEARFCPCGCGMRWNAIVEQTMSILGKTREEAETLMRKLEESRADAEAAQARRAPTPDPSFWLQPINTARGGVVYERQDGPVTADVEPGDDEELAEPW